MDVSVRKVNFVQEFLRINDETLIDKLENLLHTERKQSFLKDMQPMTLDEFNAMIDQSENDIRNGKCTDANDLLQKIQNWK
jgi:hypothetical protein